MGKLRNRIGLTALILLAPFALISYVHLLYVYATYLDAEWGAVSIVIFVIFFIAFWATSDIIRNNL